LLATWAVHDLPHLHQISRVMAHQYREAVSLWTNICAFCRVLVIALPEDPEAPQTALEQNGGQVRASWFIVETHGHQRQRLDNPKPSLKAPAEQRCVAGRH